MPDQDLTRARWRKSTRSTSNGDCVEVATNLDGIVPVRDSKDKNGPALVFSREAWAEFIAGIKEGELE